MANYGTGSVTFYSPEHNLIVAILKAYEDLPENHTANVPEPVLINLVVALDKNWQRYASIGYDIRDTIFDCSGLQFNTEYKLWYIQISFEFAWNIKPDVFKVICKDIFKGHVDYVCTGDESAGDYFINTDINSIFYPWRYYAEITKEDEDAQRDCFNTKESLINWLRERLHDIILYKNIDQADIIAGIKDSMSVKELEDYITNILIENCIAYDICTIAEYETEQI